MDFNAAISSVLSLIKINAESISKLAESIKKIYNRIENIEDRLDKIEKVGKYRQYGPSPYDASARR